MSDKLQFVANLRTRLLTKVIDKLQFVGHPKRCGVKALSKFSPEHRDVDSGKTMNILERSGDGALCPTNFRLSLTFARDL